MPTYTFPEISRKVIRKLKCRTCGKSFNRQQTFTMTESPFNKNPDGTVRTSAEIWKALGEQCEGWQPDDECGRCRDGRIEDERRVLR